MSLRGRLARLADGLVRLAVRAAPPAGRRGLLIVSAGGLGDTVLFALVLPRLLALAAAGEPVTVLLRREAARMGFLFPAGVSVLAVDFARLADDVRYRFGVLRDLRRAGYRMVVSADHLRHPHLDEALIGACAAPEAAAMEPRPWPKYDAALRARRRQYPRLVDSGPPRRDKVLRLAAFADWLVDPARDGRSDPRPLPRLRLPGAPPSERRRTLLMQPFSAVAEKQVPPAIWQALIASLPGFEPVVLGAPGDLDRHPAYRTLLESARFDTTPFADLVPALRAAGLVVSVDTALMHLAVVAGAPTLCLASAAYIGEIVPYDDRILPDNVEFLYHAWPCAGCLGACIHPARDGMYPCIADITAAEAVAAARRLVDVEAIPA